jgi:Secretion system C-terminal sorting domain
MKNILILLLQIVFIQSFAQTEILFDNRKGESAGNADWVVDADVFNLGINSSGALYIGGQEANAQVIATPYQSGITASTAENFWTGGLSAWAVDMAKKGFTIETLPYNGNITYGSTFNAQDLSNYKVYIVCEPNLVFTAAEKAAIINFVANGGGLYMIADHEGADRNFDGWDARQIWNDLMMNNTIKTNPFGITFDSVDISGTYTNMIKIPADSIINGVGGTVAKIQFAGGTTMTLDTMANNTVRADAKKNTNTNTIGNVLHAHCKYGKGKVAAIGDSSPADDGTGDANDVLYDGYYTDAAGNHRKLFINTTLWLAKTDSVAKPNSIQQIKALKIAVYPNPINNYVNIESAQLMQSITIYNTNGQEIFNKQVNTFSHQLNLNQIAAGLYCMVVQANGQVTKINLLKK